MSTPRSFEDHRRYLARELAKAEERELMLKNDTPTNTPALREAVREREAALVKYARWVETKGR